MRLLRRLLDYRAVFENVLADREANLAALIAPFSRGQVV
jgi:hypothetical protein